MHWYVYLLRCADGSLYAGITTDPPRRLREHNGGRAGARYTRARRPVEMVWQQAVASRAEAARCEYSLRQLSRQQKEELVANGGQVMLRPPPLTEAGPAPADILSR